MNQFGDLSKLFVPEQTNEMSPELYQYLYQLLANKRLNDTSVSVRNPEGPLSRNYSFRLWH